MTFYPGAAYCKNGSEHTTTIAWTPFFRRSVLYCAVCGQIPRQGYQVKQPGVLRSIAAWVGYVCRHFAFDERN